MRKDDLLPKRHILFCGADCSNCDAYKRFLAGDESGLVNPENDYRCCWLPKDYPRGRDCPIRTCCEEKGILFCGECGQFEQCVTMKEFYSKPGYDELRRGMLEQVSKSRKRDASSSAILQRENAVNWGKTIAFVHQRGNRLDQLRLRHALGQPYTSVEAEKALAPYQFPDGSWDYDAPEEKPDRIGSLGGTIHCLRWLREFGLGGHPRMVRTLEFLASIQAADGSFYETEAKLAHSPYGWLKEETLIDRFYFTAAVPMRLFSLGYREHPIVGPALKWLKLHWMDWELVTGTWYNLWALLCIYSAAIELSGTLYRRCYATALEWLPHLEAQPLTWLLDALHGARFSADEPLVAKGIARLLILQDKDGAWSDPRYSTVETTITALRLLRDYGSAPRRESEGVHL